MYSISRILEIGSTIPELSTFTEDCSYNLRYLDAVLTLAAGPATIRCGGLSGAREENILDLMN